MGMTPTKPRLLSARTQADPAKPEDVPDDVFVQIAV
jgi:hypothetical protein